MASRLRRRSTIGALTGLVLLVLGCRGRGERPLGMPMERIARSNAIHEGKDDLDCRKVDAKIVSYSSFADEERYQVAVGGCGQEVLYEARCAALACAVEMMGVVGPVGEYLDPRSEE